MKKKCRGIHTALVKAGWLIDGGGAPAKRHGWLHVVRGSVDRVGEEYRAQPLVDAPEMTVIDLSAYTVLPALIDSHVHLVMSGSPDETIRSTQPAAAFEDAATVIRGHVEASQQHGVMAVRDGGDANGHVTRYKESRKNGPDGHFVLKTANRGWYRPGRYGRIVGGAPLTGKGDLTAIERGMARADHVKLVNSGLNSLKTFGRQTTPQFSRETLSAIVSLAKTAAKPVMVHVNGELPVADAVMAGVSSIEHGYFMGRENLDRMADAGIFWVPTVAPMFAYARLGGEGADIAAQNMDHQLEQLTHARKAGVKVALGTDAGSPGVNHGAGVGLEMTLFLQAGYTLEEVIQTATAHGADLLGMKDRGCLWPGMPALFIAVPGPPEKVPQNLSESIVYTGNE
ncbi:MAG: amidohydrolase family protein [Thermodesulfobacteriota bacterium]|nr:amidohydrolase family protein [Thermodesulfobacteriota bacterium]